jgi:alkylated DNA repair dioxygenase AlkB
MAQPAASSIQQWAVPGIPGLYYRPQLLSPEETRALTAYLRDPKAILPCVHHGGPRHVDLATVAQWQAVPNPKDKSTGHWSRCHVQFGASYRYGSDRHETAYDKLFDPAPDIPAALLPSKLANEKWCSEWLGEPVEFDQAIVNRYERRQGIRNHIDHQLFGDVIACHSLNADATMSFWNPGERNDRYLDVLDGSSYAMSGDARYKSHHGMPRPDEAADIDRPLLQAKGFGQVENGGGRFSITWRKLKRTKK